MLWHKCSFPNSHFLDSGRKKLTKGSQALTAKPAIAFPEIAYITVILSYVSASDCSLKPLNCDCCFCADLFMVTALLVKHYQIKLLKKVWCILLVLCTWFNSFSIQLEAHQVNKILIRENDQKPEPRKKRAPGPDPHSWKPTAPEAELELCHFYDSFTALNNTRCNQAHRRSRVKI